MVKIPPVSAGDMKDEFDPWIRKRPWRREWQLTPIFLPGEPTDRGAWWATVQGLARVRRD